MIIFVLAFLLITYFFVDNKNFIYALMVFFLLFDMVDGFYKDVKIFAAIRYVVPFVLILIFAFSKKIFVKSDWIFLLLVVYLIVLMAFNVGDPIQSGKNILAIIIAVFMLLIGRYLGKNRDFLNEFEPFSRFMVIAVPIYIIFSNVFKVGESYTSSFYVGFYDTSRMYVLPIIVFLRIHYTLTNKSSRSFLRIFDFSLIGLNIIILMLTTRRTTVAILLVSIIVYAFYNKEAAFKVVLTFGFLIIALIVSFPLYQSTLNDQLEKRERIQNVDTYEEEGRYLETIYIWHYHKMKQSPKELFIGVKLFDTEEFGNIYFHSNRGIHSDINMIIYSTGIFGLFLFTAFFINYLWIGNSKMVAYNKQLFFPFLAIFLLILIPGRFIGTFTFAPLIMLFLGASKNLKHSNFQKH